MGEMQGPVVIERFAGSDQVAVCVGKTGHQGYLRTSRLSWAEVLKLAVSYAGPGATVRVRWVGERRGPRGYLTGFLNTYRIQLPRERAGS